MPIFCTRHVWVCSMNGCPYLRCLRTSRSSIVWDSGICCVLTFLSHLPHSATACVKPLIEPFSPLSTSFGHSFGSVFPALQLALAPTSPALSFFPLLPRFASFTCLSQLLYRISTRWRTSKSPASLKDRLPVLCKQKALSSFHMYCQDVIGASHHLFGLVRGCHKQACCSTSSVAFNQLRDQECRSLDPPALPQDGQISIQGHHPRGTSQGSARPVSRCRAQPSTITIS